MHIPDGFIDPKFSGGLLGAAAAVLALCLQKVVAAITAKVPAEALAAAGRGMGNLQSAGRRVLTALGEEQLLRMAGVAGLIFAAQMFNFPIGSGTSGHLLGGVFAGIVLGPFAGTVVMALVLGVQALVFGDGGLLAWGANFLNMAGIGSIGGYYLFTWLSRKLPELPSAGLTAWVSVVLAALAAALEIGLSGTIELRTVTLAMLQVHVKIGLAEALLTMLLLLFYPRGPRS